MEMSNHFIFQLPNICTIDVKWLKHYWYKETLPGKLQTMSSKSGKSNRSNSLENGQISFICNNIYLSVIFEI